MKPPAWLRGYRITRSGLLFLLSLALTGTTAFATGNNLLFLLFSAMMALLLVSGLIGRLVLAGLELELLLPRHVAARAPTEARVRLRNLKRLTASFSIELHGDLLHEPIYFPLIPGREAVEAAVTVTFPRRGRHRENLFVLRTQFPFGFVHREARIPIVRDTLVYPAIETTPAAEQLLAEIADRPGAGQEFHRIRPWVPDDGARHVDWKTTARTAQLHTREFASESDSAVEIELVRAIPKGAEQRFEAVIEECAWLLWTLADEGRDFVFQCDGREETDVHEALRCLAMVEPTVSPQAGKVLAEPGKIVFRV